MYATVGLYGQSPEPQNEAIGTKFRHLVVDTSQTPYERSIKNNHTPISLVKIGYRLLGHLPGDRPTASMMRCPRKYRLGHALKVLCPFSNGSTLRVKNSSMSSEEALVHLPDRQNRFNLLYRSKESSIHGVEAWPMIRARMKKLKAFNRTEDNGFKSSSSNMEEDLRHVQKALEGLEDQLSCLAKGVEDLKREEEAILEQSNRRSLSGRPMHNNHWRYGKFSFHARSYKHNSYDIYEGNRLDSHNYGGHNYRRSYQTLGTTSRPLSNNNSKLPLLCGTFGPYDCGACEQKVELLFYSFCKKEAEKFQLVLKSLSYKVNLWWDCKCENRRRMGAESIKTWSLMKQSLINRFGVGNHEGQSQGQSKDKNS
ncbi:hypothetical protein M9H77_12762 [Catharanthus roseus]|uniref:Uncharacterized protein n=1 Tax=Catharanthus roseus TaxID=4058 RepID=A0ACC0BII5_CATRO|nr:hypothetical protein M9H77_12762 [Catharanthus roseus]